MSPVHLLFLLSWTRQASLTVNRLHATIATSEEPLQHVIAWAKLSNDNSLLGDLLLYREASSFQKAYCP